MVLIRFSASHVQFLGKPPPHTPFSGLRETQKQPENLGNKSFTREQDSQVGSFLQEALYQKKQALFWSENFRDGP